MNHETSLGIGALPFLKAASSSDISAHIAQAIRENNVHWMSNSNEKRVEHVDGMVYEFHFLPSLAYKALIHSQTNHPSVEEKCFLCHLDPKQTIAPDLAVPVKLRINNFPFMEDQSLLGEPTHSPDLSYQCLVDGIRVANEYGFNLAFSDQQSGASFFAHAHIHLFSTHLALHDLSPAWDIKKEVNIGHLPTYPGSILVVEGNDAQLVAQHVMDVLSNIRGQIVGYNIQYDGKNHRLFFIPRRKEKSEILGGIALGATTVSGLFQPDARGYVGTSLEMALEIIRERYLGMTGGRMREVIEELVFPKDFYFDSIVPFVKGE